jgi:hypothetical protein
MKLLTRILSLLILATFATFYMGCGGDNGDDQTEEEKQFNKLKSTWVLESANDGTVRTADFAGLILTLQGSFAQGGTFQYSFTGTRPNPSPWPASGTWKFGQSPSTEIIRDPGSDDELEATYEVTDGALEISFVVPDGHPGWAGSRVESVSGAWTFTFTKQ